MSAIATQVITAFQRVSRAAYSACRRRVVIGFVIGPFKRDRVDESRGWAGQNSVSDCLMI